MALEDGVRLVLERMRKEAKGANAQWGGGVTALLEGFADQLEMVLASATQPPRVEAVEAPLSLFALRPEREPRQQEVLTQARRRSNAEEELLGEQMRTCEGGPEDGTTTFVNAQVPKGGWIEVGGSTYRLEEGGRLVHDPVAEEKIKAMRARDAQKGEAR